MSRRVVTMIVGAALLALLGVLAMAFPVPYAALGPGPTFNTLGSVDGTRVVTVTDEKGHLHDAKTSGHLQMVTVGVRGRLDLLSALRGWIDDDVAVIPRAQVFPPDKTEQQVNDENTREFVQSQNAAEAAALGELHYPKQVMVHEILKGSPSRNELRADDVIASLNGTKVTDTHQLIAALSAVDPGTQVDVGYLRDGKAGSTRITTTAATDRKGAALGVSVSTRRVAPFDIDVSLDDVGGPSAGLMFALGIMEDVSGKDLTGGRFVAGTGTINPDGEVGPIGGIPQKMRAAKRDGASVFLVPVDNCAEARSTAPSGLRLVRVGTLHTAVQALNELDRGGHPAGC